MLRSHRVQLPPLALRADASRGNPAGGSEGLAWGGCRRSMFIDNDQLIKLSSCEAVEREPDNVTIFHVMQQLPDRTVDG